MFCVHSALWFKVTDSPSAIFSSGSPTESSPKSDSFRAFTQTLHRSIKKEYKIKSIRVHRTRKKKQHGQGILAESRLLSWSFFLHSTPATAAANDFQYALQQVRTQTIVLSRSWQLLQFKSIFYGFIIVLFFRSQYGIYKYMGQRGRRAITLSRFHQAFTASLSQILFSIWLMLLVGGVYYSISMEWIAGDGEKSIFSFSS